jgi:hypothetical protein
MISWNTCSHCEQRGISSDRYSVGMQLADMTKMYISSSCEVLRLQVKSKLKSRANGASGTNDRVSIALNCIIHSH